MTGYTTTDQWPAIPLATFDADELDGRSNSRSIYCVHRRYSCTDMMIDTQDIGFVKPGQEVRLKLAAYPFQRYGIVDGVVKTVIAESQLQNSKQVDSQQTSKENTTTNTEGGVASTMTFEATIELKRQSLMVNDSSLPLAAGMQLSAEIIEGKRTMLQYLLSPVQRVASEAGMER